MSYFEDFLRARDPQKATKKPVDQTGNSFVDKRSKSEDLERASVTKVLSEEILQGGLAQDATETPVDQTGDNSVDNQSKSEDLERASITKTLSEELPRVQSPSPIQYSPLVFSCESLLVLEYLSMTKMVCLWTSINDLWLRLHPDHRELEAVGN